MKCITVTPYKDCGLTRIAYSMFNGTCFLPFDRLVSFKLPPPACCSLPALVRTGKITTVLLLLLLLPLKLPTVGLFPPGLKLQRPTVLLVFPPETEGLQSLRAIFSCAFISKLTSLSTFRAQ